MNEIRNLKDNIDIKYKELPSVPQYNTNKFYHILIDNNPIGNPLTKPELDVILSWFRSINFEFNVDTQEWDRF